MFTLTCQAYKDNETIPTKYTHSSVAGGKNVSPGFSWTDSPVDTKSFVFSLVDPHPVANNWIHWLVINIPFRDRMIVEGASRSDKLPSGSRELMNSFNELGYGGPAPPRGSGVHPYVAVLYALNVEKLDLATSTPLSKFLRVIEGKVIAEATLTGLYERK
jgi:Raf kinase inhibitor-like YbhB/YbcL family protein